MGEKEGGLGGRRVEVETGIWLGLVSTMIDGCWITTTTTTT